jgi:tetratricopeptide (TPR) repeat protein
MTKDDKPMKRKRKRGVVASRVKLEKAMLRVGIKTQISLANKIAEIENIDTPPKDLVNKAFRGLSVSHYSVQRIANALEVEAYALYQTQKEVDLREDASYVDSENDVTQSPLNETHNEPQFFPLSSLVNNKRLNTIIGSILFLSVAVLLSSYFYQYSEASPTHNTSTYIDHEILFSGGTSKLGRYSMVVLYDEKSEDLNKELEGLFSKSVNVLPSISSAIAKIKEQNPDDIISSLGVDYVLTISNLQKGRYQSHVVQLHNAQQKHLIWSKFSTLAEFEINKNNLLSDINDAVMQALGLTNLKIVLPRNQLTPIAIMYYLEGLDLLDGSQNQLNVKGAQSRFANVIRYEPEFAQAYAGLCEALLLESWTNNEKEMIKSAQPLCQKAVALASDNDHVAAAQSLFLRKTGRVKEAINLLHKQIELSPLAANLHYLAAYAEYDAHNQFSDDPELLQHAESHVNHAIEIDPNYWKPYFVLGLISWASGDLETSVQAMKNAYQIEANELVLTNLGVFSMCAGNISEAAKYFNESVSVSPDSHLGYEMLGLTHFYSKRFQQSIDSRLQAIKNAGSANVHQIWGDLADSYFAIQDWDNAAKDYQKALTIIESDMALGNTLVSDNAHQIYYLHRLSLLNKQDRELASLVAKELNNFDLAPSELGGSAQVKLAIAYFEVNKLQKAESYFRQSLKTCPMYLQHPNIVEFAKNIEV